jgi:hypothetical protein
MPNLKDADQVVEKLGVDKAKIPISKKVYREIKEKAKNIALDQILNKK